MIYFKKDGEPYAFDEDDLKHDDAVKKAINILEAEKLNPPDRTEKHPEDYDALIAELRSEIRIGDEFIPITEAEKDELLKPTDEQLAIQHAMSEHYWVKSELENVQVQLMYHWTSDPRAEATVDAWSQYAQQLRNYTSTDDDGNPYIRDGEPRPVSPLDSEAAQ